MKTYQNILSRRKNHAGSSYLPRGGGSKGSLRPLEFRDSEIRMRMSEPGPQVGTALEFEGGAS